jgi:DNA-binding MarR family transcriptional regulator
MSKKETPFSVEKAEDSSGFLLWQVTLLWQRKIKHELDLIGITHTQFVLLASLAWLGKNKTSVTQIDLSKHSKCDQMMVSKVLKTLIEKGFINRKEHDTDTRAKSLSLSKEGLKIILKAVPIVESIDKNFFGVLKNTSLFNSQMLTILKENS